MENEEMTSARFFLFFVRLSSSLESQKSFLWTFVNPFLLNFFLGDFVLSQKKRLFFSCCFEVEKKTRKNQKSLSSELMCQQCSLENDFPLSQRVATEGLWIAREKETVTLHQWPLECGSTPTLVYSMSESESSMSISSLRSNRSR